MGLIAHILRFLTNLLTPDNLTSKYLYLSRQSFPIMKRYSNSENTIKTIFLTSI